MLWGSPGHNLPWLHWPWNIDMMQKPSSNQNALNNAQGIGVKLCRQCSQHFLSKRWQSNRGPIGGRAARRVIPFLWDILCGMAIVIWIINCTFDYNMVGKCRAFSAVDSWDWHGPDRPIVWNKGFKPVVQTIVLNFFVKEYRSFFY